MTVKDVIEGILKKTGAELLPYEKTCDHLMTGSYDMEVTKIVTTFMATVEVVRKTIEILMNRPGLQVVIRQSGWKMIQSILKKRN